MTRFVIRYNREQGFWQVYDKKERAVFEAGYSKARAIMAAAFHNGHGGYR